MLGVYQEDHLIFLAGTGAKVGRASWQERYSSERDDLPFPFRTFWEDFSEWNGVDIASSCAHIPLPKRRAMFGVVVPPGETRPLVPRSVSKRLGAVGLVLLSLGSALLSSGVVNDPIWGFGAMFIGLGFGLVAALGYTVEIPARRKRDTLP